METVAFCEIDPFCQKVLKKHWPDVPCYSDITKLTAEQLENDGITGISVLTGGYPCQPFSHAGKREGEKDDRHLWPEMYRLARTIKPRWVVAENVAGHISMGLDQVLSDLEAIGYEWWAFVIPACAKDAWHRRDRVWIMAYSESRENNGRKPGVVGTAPEGGRRINSTVGAGCEDVAYTMCKPIQGNGAGGKQEPDIRQQNKQAEGRQSPVRERGFWTIEPSVGRVVDGVSAGMDRAKRLRSLGNAVVPQVVEEIGRAIMEQA